MQPPMCCRRVRDRLLEETSRRSELSRLMVKISVVINMNLSHELGVIFEGDLWLFEIGMPDLLPFKAVAALVS